MIKNLIVSTFLSLRAHKLRVFLTMIGIIIGIAAVVTVSAIGEGMKRESMKMIETTDANVIRLIYQPNYDDDAARAGQAFQDFSLSYTDLKALRPIEQVSQISADYRMFGFGSLEAISVSIAYFGAAGTAEIMAYEEPVDVAFGHSFTENEQDQNKIILTYEVVQEILNVSHPEDIIGQAVDIDGIKFQVIGIKPKSEDNPRGFEEQSFYSVVPKKAFRALSKDKPIQAIKLKLMDQTDRATVLNEANELLLQLHPELTGSFVEDKTNQEMIQQIESVLQSIMLGLLFITAISLLVGGIGVMNIMYVSVTERKREIGIRRAIGAKPRNILMQFLLESAIITFLGGLIGIGLGAIFALLISLFTPLEAVVSLNIALISAGVSAAIGIVFGVVPAINASRMDPIKAIYQ